MSKTAVLRKQIAELASELFSTKIKVSNVAAEPICIKQGCEKKNLYCVSVYDNSLNVLIEAGPNTYVNAFEDLRKRLVAEQHRKNKA